MTESGQNGDIYDILEACTNDELTPIVDTLIKSSISILQISRSFERHNPNHILYNDRIGDEIYRLAHVALGRGDGRRPSYDLIIIALCKKIGVPSAANDVKANETLLLNLFLKQHLTSSTFDRQALIDEARSAASSAASGMLSSEAWSPLASVFLQIIYLKRKLAEEGRWPNSAQLLISDKTQLAETRDVSGDVDKNDFTVSLASLPDFDVEWREAKRNTNLINLFYPFLEAVQPLVVGAQFLNGETLWRVSSEGSAHIVEKGYQGMRSLQPVSVASLLGPTAFLTLASAMVEQKKLDDIQKSLDKIKSAIADVSKFQKAERRSVMTGAIRYFHQVAPSVLQGELASEVSHEIERHEVELVRVQDHLIQEARDQIAIIRGAKKDIKAIQDAQENLGQMYGEILLCIRARACGYQLMCAFPGRDAGKRARFEDISGALSILSPTSEVTVLMDQAVREKVKGFSSYETKIQLLAKEEKIFEQIQAETSAILKGLRATEERPSGQDDIVYIDLKVQSGRIVATRTV